MRITQEGDYALRVVYFLYRNGRGQRVEAKVISENENIPLRFLLKLLRHLSHRMRIERLVVRPLIGRAQIHTAAHDRQQRSRPGNKSSAIQRPHSQQQPFWPRAATLGVSFPISARCPACSMQEAVRPSLENRSPVRAFAPDTGSSAYA